MPKLVRDLIQGQRLTSVSSTSTLHEAVCLMFDNNYSQLPVVDGEHLKGILTERELITAMRFGTPKEVLGAPVSSWMERRPSLIGLRRSIYDAVRALRNTSALVVVEGDKPKAVLTDYDIAEFLSEWSWGLALAEDIELRLRGYTDRVLRTQDAKSLALYYAFNKSREEDGRELVRYDELSLGDQIKLITTAKNWVKFEPYLRPKTTFSQFMDAVNKIRNQAAHFRGQLTDAQIKTLQAADRWLEGRPKVPEAALQSVSPSQTGDEEAG